MQTSSVSDDFNLEGENPRERRSKEKWVLMTNLTLMFVSLVAVARRDHDSHSQAI
jgi:hypothetical protein